MNNCMSQRRSQSSFKHVRWSFLKILLATSSRFLFSQRAPSYVFDWVLNTPLRATVYLLLLSCIWTRLHWLQVNNGSADGVVLVSLLLTLNIFCAFFSLILYLFSFKGLLFLVFIVLIHWCQFCSSQLVPIPIYLKTCNFFKNRLQYRATL